MVSHSFVCLFSLVAGGEQMQQLELAQMQQRDANLTALAAIGPRKKRPLDPLCFGSGNEVGNAIMLHATMAPLLVCAVLNDYTPPFLIPPPPTPYC